MADSPNKQQTAGRKRKRCPSYGPNLVQQSWTYNAAVLDVIWNVINSHGHDEKSESVEVFMENATNATTPLQPPPVRPTMQYLSEHENKRLTSRAWHNVLANKVKINKAFVMVYLSKETDRGALQGGQLVLPWITWASGKCQLSGLLWKAGAGAFPRDNIQYQMSPDIDRDPGGRSEFLLLPLHSSAPYPRPSLFPVPCSPLDLAGAPRLLSLAHPVTRQSALNTKTCYLNVIKCKYLAIFLMLRERERKRERASGGEGSRWHAHNKQKAQLDNSRKVTTSPPGRQTHKQINSIVFLYLESHGVAWIPPSGLLLLFGQRNPAKGSH